MKNIYITFCILLYGSSLSQEFKYNYTVTEKIDNTEVIITFNTLDGVYRDLYCINGEILDNHFAKINLTDAEKITISSLIREYEINGLEDCGFVPHDKLNSSVSFELIGDLQDKKCADPKVTYKIRELQGRLIDIIRGKPEYRKVFYWEFISK